jgi:tetratricopeptide (TPR) repeat protein
MGWFPRSPVLYLAGLAHYRAGKYEKSTELLRESLTSSPEWPTKAVGYPALALAHHRAGRMAEARKALASADKALDGWTKEMQAAPVGTMPLPWFDWIDFLCLHREATRLITGTSPPEDLRSWQSNGGHSALQPE